MSVTNLRLYHADGRLKGSYVYMLMCHRDKTIYIKVGMTDIPTQRLMALRNNCAVPPKIFAIVETFSRKEALRIESELHAALENWRGQGEWFLFRDEDKEKFNQAWQTVFERCAVPGWPLFWVKIPVKPVIQDAKRRAGYYRYRWSLKGRAYRDFEQHLRSSQ